MILKNFVNWSVGREYLGISQHKGEIIGLAKNGIILKKGKQCKAILRTYPLIEKKLGLVLNSVKIYKDWCDERKTDFDYAKALLQFSGIKRNFLLPQIFYSSADVYNTTSDDSGYVSNNGAVYATVRGASAGNSTTQQTGTSGLRAVCSVFAGPDYYVQRAFIAINTSVLGSGAVISAAVLKLYADVKGGTSTTAVVQGTPASNTTLVDGDFDQAGSTEGTDTRVDPTTSQYNDHTLNATGRGWISVGGYTVFALRNTKDIDNTTPGEENKTQYSDATYSGTTRDPYITITYTPGAKSLFFAQL